MSVDCLLDTNAVVKYYHNEVGSEVIQYVFDKSPPANINILNIHVAEVISTFYKLRAKNALKTDDDRDKLIDTFLKDIASGKIKLYDFRTEHLKDVIPVLGKTFTIPPPIRRKGSHLNLFSGKLVEFKELADTMDVLLLVAMREIQYILGESYLFTSDGHVLEVAKSLNLATLNPEITPIGGLPVSLDRRKNRRMNLSIKVVCADLETAAPLGTARTLNICESGACLSVLDNIVNGKVVGLKLSSFNNPKNILEVQGETIWSSEKGIGVKFLDLIPVHQLS